MQKGDKIRQKWSHEVKNISIVYSGTIANVVPKHTDLISIVFLGNMEENYYTCVKMKKQSQRGKFSQKHQKSLFQGQE